MGLSEEIERLKFDKRLLDWNLANGKISKEEYESFLKNLNDTAENCTPLDFTDSEFSSLN